MSQKGLRQIGPGNFRLVPTPLATALDEVIARERIEATFGLSTRGARDLMRTLPCFTVGKRKFIRVIFSA